MFQRTRGDVNEIRDHAIMSTKPLRYINVQNQRNMNPSNHEESIDISSELREKPTRLNEFNRTNTFLSGTSAYMASGVQDPSTEINIESDLIFGSSTSTNGFSNRQLTEKQHYRPDFLDIDLLTDSSLRSKSTRNEMRNNYGKFNCYRQRQ
jgi:hypothetical protein